MNRKKWVWAVTVKEATGYPFTQNVFIQCLQQFQHKHISCRFHTYYFPNPFITNTQHLEFSYLLFVINYSRSRYISIRIKYKKGVGSSQLDALLDCTVRVLWDLTINTMWRFFADLFVILEKDMTSCLLPARGRRKGRSLAYSVMLSGRTCTIQKNSIETMKHFCLSDAMNICAVSSACPQLSLLWNR